MVFIFFFFFYVATLPLVLLLPVAPAMSQPPKKNLKLSPLFNVAHGVFSSLPEKNPYFVLRLIYMD